MPRPMRRLAIASCRCSSSGKPETSMVLSIMRIADGDQSGQLRLVDPRLPR